MTNFKFSEKFHIFIIVSSVLIALGVAVGIICQFLSTGFFNFAEENASYKYVTVSYAYVDYENEDELKKLCDDEFGAGGVKYFEWAHGESQQGGELTYKFSKSTSDDKLSAATSAIDTAVKGKSGISSASFGEAKTEFGAIDTLIYGAIGLSSAIVFQFIYFAVRFTLSGAVSGLLADLHNLLLFLSLAAITRVPFGSVMYALAVITVFATMISCIGYFDRVRKNAKGENAALDAFALCDLSARENFIVSAFISVGLAAFGVLVFGALSASALSVSPILASAVGVVLCAASNMYGSALFTPSVHARLRFAFAKVKSAPKKGEN